MYDVMKLIDRLRKRAYMYKYTSGSDTSDLLDEAADTLEKIINAVVSNSNVSGIKDCRYCNFYDLYSRACKIHLTVSGGCKDFVDAKIL